eukprot:snap_masked-scaffold_36-processed-gene-2.54-mRNA-1 protein AED:1.00 eAED:1.00 QI:0/-1/0/0/-1/1/1/0/61
MFPFMVKILETLRSSFLLAASLCAMNQLSHTNDVTNSYGHSTDSYGVSKKYEFSGNVSQVH